MAGVLNLLKTPVTGIVTRHSVALARRAVFRAIPAEVAPHNTSSQFGSLDYLKSPNVDQKIPQTWFPFFSKEQFRAPEPLKSQNIGLNRPQVQLTPHDTEAKSQSYFSFPPNILKPSCYLEPHKPQNSEVAPHYTPSQSCLFSFPPNALKKFRSLEPLKPQDASSKIPHLSKVSKFNLGFPRTFFFKKKPDKRNDPKKRRVPKLILLQNPLTWVMIKIDFSVLRSIWDPTFREKEFKYGTKQAISRVTNLISEGQFSELNGLLTKAARVSLKKELDRNWSSRQRSLLALKKEDIQISSPRKVYFIRISDKKFCDVDMAFLALKWAPINTVEALIFTEIFARFHREYTPHCIPEWTIAYFKVTRFEVLRRK